MSIWLLQLLLQSGGQRWLEKSATWSTDWGGTTRVVVPKDLRRFVGKAELRLPLCGGYQQALKLLPSAV
jgi:hypothetical protein